LAYYFDSILVELNQNGPAGPAGFISFSIPDSVRKKAIYCLANEEKASAAKERIQKDIENLLAQLINGTNREELNPVYVNEQQRLGDFMFYVITD
ncbi:MAG: hypothetical protein OXB84_03355, partial [Halobacteriovoraceae bacterium]|nr:hypothetical protein [Halobacteriovoraceae bacterium]